MPIRRATALVRHLRPLLLLCLAIAAAPAAGAPALVSSFGSAGANTAIKAMTRDADGNFYVAGTFGGSRLMIGGARLDKSQAAADIFVAKLAADGTTAWAQSFGSEDNTFDPTVSAIAVGGTGQVYVAGSFAGNFSDLLADAQSGSYGFVLSTHGGGSFDWGKAFTGTNVEILGLAGDVGRNAVFVAGSFGQGSLTSPPLPLTGSSDGFVARLGADTGTVGWVQSVGGTGAVTTARNLALDPVTQTAYFAGIFYGGSLTSPPLTRVGQADAAVLRIGYDGSGLNVVQSFSGPGTGVGIRGLVIDDTGALMLAGLFNEGSITSPPAAALAGLGSDDGTGFAVKLATGGSVTWATRFGSRNAYMNLGAIRSDGSRLYIAGSIEVSGIDTPAAAAMTLIGDTDGFLLVLGHNGQVVEAHNYGGPGASLKVKDLAVDGQGATYLAGEFSTGSLTIPPASRVGNTDAIILGDRVAPLHILTIAAPAHGSVSAPGGIACGTSCATSYANGATVTLTATPDTGYTFAGWGGDCAGTDNPLTLTMTAAKSCAVSFAASNAGGNPAPSAPSTPAAPPAFVANPVPTTLDAATTGAGSGKLSLAAAFTNPAALSFAVSSGSNTPLPAWLTFDPATVSFSYDVPLPGNLPIQPVADGDADTRTGRADARASWANTIYPPLIRVAQLPVTLTATGAGQSYAATIRMSFYAPRPRVAIAALSLSQDGALGNARSTRPALSFDAGQVLFQTAATNLFPAAPNTDTDIVRYHALSGTRDRLSQTAIPGGGVANAANGASLNPAVSPDGRFAAFASDAPGITLTPSGRVRQVYRATLAHPRIDLDPARTPAPDVVSATADGSPGNAPSDKPALSEDARFVAFESAATNLAPGLDGTRQVWRKDLSTGAIALVSANGTPGNGPSGNPSISWDGRFVAFESAATNLAANPGTGTQLYLKDMNTGAVRLVSAQAGRPANAAATSPVLSARADKLAFVTSATNLGFANQAGRAQIVIADLDTNSINLVSDTSTDSDQPAISADGRFVVFRAAAAGSPQIWVRDTARGVTALVTQTAAGTPGTAASWAPAIAGDASTIAFASDARDLVNGNPAAGQAYIAANPLVIPQKTAYWYSPDIGGGQGWITERWGDRAYVAALAYDANGRSQWLAGFCSISGLTCSGTLQGWTGGTPFGLPGAASPVPARGPAFAILTADTGRTATLAIAGGTPATLAPYPIGGSATTALAGLPQAGWWYEPDAAGSANGYFLGIATQAQSGGGTAQIGYLSVLTFDAAGRPEWLSAQATLAADLAFAATLYRYQGGAPIGQPDAAGNPDALAVGQVRLSFDGTDQATITLPNGRIANIRRFRF